MRRSLFLTAATRPHYFQETMESWRKVRGFYDWNVVIRLEPTEHVAEHQRIIYELGHEKLQVIVNPKVYGVLHHPWVGFNELFLFSDFVVRAEDDLVVSEDILEYFEWASEEYKGDPEIATVNAFSRYSEATDTSSVSKSSDFNPWLWGTWHDRWDEYIRDTWDHEYSTYNISPGNESGWDWNLNTRILPSLGKKIVVPDVSRVQNIGVYGVHGNPDNFEQAVSYQSVIPPVEYRERDSR